jgi:hypothetical protein
MDDTSLHAEEERFRQQLKANAAGRIESELLAELSPFFLAGLEFPQYELSLAASFRTKFGEDRRVYVFDGNRSLIVVTDATRKPLFCRTAPISELNAAHVEPHPSGKTIVLRESLRIGRRTMEHHFALESSDLTCIRTTYGPNW